MLVRRDDLGPARWLRPAAPAVSRRPRLRLAGGAGRWTCRRRTGCCGLPRRGRDPWRPPADRLAPASEEPAPGRPSGRALHPVGELSRRGPPVPVRPADVRLRAPRLGIPRREAVPLPAADELLAMVSVLARPHRILGARRRRRRTAAAAAQGSPCSAAAMVDAVRERRGLLAQPLRGHPARHGVPGRRRRAPASVRGRCRRGRDRSGARRGRQPADRPGTRGLDDRSPRPQPDGPAHRGGRARHPGPVGRGLVARWWTAPGAGRGVELVAALHGVVAPRRHGFTGDPVAVRRRDGVALHDPAGQALGRPPAGRRPRRSAGRRRRVRRCPSTGREPGGPGLDGRELRPAAGAHRRGLLGTSRDDGRGRGDAVARAGGCSDGRGRTLACLACGVRRRARAFGDGGVRAGCVADGTGRRGRRGGRACLHRPTRHRRSCTTDRDRAPPGRPAPAVVVAAAQDAVAVPDRGRPGRSRHVVGGGPRGDADVGSDRRGG